MHSLLSALPVFWGDNKPKVKGQSQHSYLSVWSTFSIHNTQKWRKTRIMMVYEDFLKTNFTLMLCLQKRYLIRKIFEHLKNHHYFTKPIICMLLFYFYFQWIQLFSFWIIAVSIKRLKVQNSILKISVQIYFYEWDSLNEIKNWFTN